LPEIIPYFRKEEITLVEHTESGPEKGEKPKPRLSADLTDMLAAKKALLDILRFHREIVRVGGNYRSPQAIGLQIAAALDKYSKGEISQEALALKIQESLPAKRRAAWKDREDMGAGLKHLEEGWIEVMRSAEARGRKKEWRGPRGLVETSGKEE